MNTRFLMLSLFSSVFRVVGWIAIIASVVLAVLAVKQGITLPSCFPQCGLDVSWMLPNGILFAYWTIAAAIGVLLEWHLLKLFGVAVFADMGTRDGARFGEQRIRFRSTFNRARLDAAGAFANVLLRDDDKERSTGAIPVAPLTIVPPRDPNLHGVFEAELAWQACGEHRRLRHHQPNQIVSQ